MEAQTAPTAATAAHLPFWDQFSQTIEEKIPVTIVASRSGEILTISVIPQKAGEIKATTLSGSATDFAEQFFSAIKQPIDAAAGLNVTAVTADAPEAPEKKEAKKPVTPAASGTKKKQPAKKTAPPADKKPAPKKPAEEEKRGRGRPPGSLNKKGTKTTPPQIPGQLDLETEAKKFEQTQTMHPGPEMNPQAEQTAATEITAGDVQEQNAGKMEQENDGLEQNAVESEQGQESTLQELSDQAKLTKLNSDFEKWLTAISDLLFFSNGQFMHENPDKVAASPMDAVYLHALYNDGKTVNEALRQAASDGRCGITKKEGN